MATYYNGGSEIQGADGLQTLVLMNPGYVYYSDSQQSTQPPTGNYMFQDHFDHTGNNRINNHHQEANVTPAQPQQFVGIPLSASPPSSIHSQHDVSSHQAYLPRAQNMYSPVEMVAREVTPFQQHLSLSLSSQQSRFGSQTAGNSPSPIVTWSHATGVIISPSGDDGRTDTPGNAGGPNSDGGSASSPSRASNSVNGMHNMLLNSKYLKATQEILEEVVNVCKVVLKNSDQSRKNVKLGCDDGDAGSPPQPTTGEGETPKSGGGTELTTAERHEIQMKKAKLVNMLDEVEQRYRQYHHQMQIVISWFEQAAGIGSAKTYTALALQTISKQFRCLKDAIVGQIKAASRSLGEEDSKADGSVSRLKFVDNQLRQQRALQQLGMIQNNAWRPQRGLPERAVSVLRAWLFEHFLHPYPKDSDKIMLAKQTGLTRSQVSNWFINARVRLWKPMVEEMYLEEIKQHHHHKQEDQSNKTDENDDKYNNSPSKQGNPLSPENQNRAFQPTKQETSFNPTTFQFQNPSNFTLPESLQTNGTEFPQFSPKKPRNTNEGFVTGLGGYSIGDQFQYSGNGVSLTLGLPDCENLSISGGQQRFLNNQDMEFRRDYVGMNPPADVYESMNVESRKRFDAQPVPDFVA